MERLTELEINSIGFAILCNFPHFCGEERAKEAYEMFRSMKKEIMDYRALGTVEELSALVKDKKDGLVVVLPCKPNATYLHRNYNTGGLELNIELHGFGGDESDLDFEEIDACAYWE